MNDVTRYEAITEWGNAVMSKYKFGDFVTYEDYTALQEQLTATTNSLTNAQEALKSAGIEADTVQAGVMELVSKLTAIIPDENVEASLNALKKGYFKRWVKEYSSAEAKSGYVAGSINVKDIVSVFNYADGCAAQLRAGNAGKDGSHE